MNGGSEPTPARTAWRWLIPAALVAVGVVVLVVTSDPGGGEWRLDSCRIGKSRQSQGRCWLPAAFSHPVGRQ